MLFIIFLGIHSSDLNVSVISGGFILKITFIKKLGVGSLTNFWRFGCISWGSHY